jgi:ribosome-binding protein aMBF1 (putative translation factor)
MVNNLKKVFTLRDAEKELIKTEKDKRQYKQEYRRLMISHQIVEFRQKYNMSQKQLAEKLHTKQQVVSRIEQQGYLPSLTTLERIASIFNKQLVVEFR